MTLRTWRGPSFESDAKFAAVYYAVDMDDVCRGVDMFAYYQDADVALRVCA